jgi:hypothetical protein
VIASAPLAPILFFPILDHQDRVRFRVFWASHVLSYDGRDNETGSGEGTYQISLPIQEERRVLLDREKNIRQRPFPRGSLCGKVGLSFFDGVF